MTDHPVEVDVVPGRHHLFCGDPVQKDSSYCAEHHKKSRRGFGTTWQQLAAMVRRAEERSYD